MYLCHRTNIRAIAIWEAVRRADVKALDSVLKMGVDVNVVDSIGRTLLMVAAENGHDQIAQLLLENRADINHANNHKNYTLRCEDGRTALHYAARMGHASMVELLLNNKAVID